MSFCTKHIFQLSIYTLTDVLHISKTTVTHAICKLYSMYDDNNSPNAST